MKLLGKTFDFFIFGNLFIALCAGAMVQSTYVLNGIENHFSAITFFTAVSTFLLYNFHYVAFHLNYSSLQSFFKSLFSVRFLFFEKMFLITALLLELVLCFFIHIDTLFLLLLMAVPALLYSVPLYSKGNRKLRLREMLFFKMPLLAFVWAFSTVIIPGVDAGISIRAPFIWFQFVARLCFIFALCIPFELRDIEFDRKNDVKTIPVVYGDRTTRILGIFIIAFEILIHHLATYNGLISFNILVALDVSSIIALIWVIFSNRLHGKYFYKVLVDGTMILRYLLLLICIRIW